MQPIQIGMQARRAQRIRIQQRAPRRGGAEQGRPGQGIRSSVRTWFWMGDPALLVRARGLPLPPPRRGEVLAVALAPYAPAGAISRISNGPGSPTPRGRLCVECRPRSRNAGDRTGRGPPLAAPRGVVPRSGRTARDRSIRESCRGPDSFWRRVMVQGGGRPPPPGEGEGGTCPEDARSNVDEVQDDLSQVRQHQLQHRAR